MQFSPTKIVTILVGEVGMFPPPTHTRRREVGMFSKDYPVSSPSRNRIVWLSSSSHSRSNYIHST